MRLLRVRAIGQTVNVVNCKGRRTGAARENRYTALEPDVSVHNPAQQRLRELIHVLTSLPRQFSETGLQRGIYGAGGRGHRRVLPVSQLSHAG